MSYSSLKPIRDQIIEVWILIERHFGCGKKTSIYAVCKNASKHGRESTFYCMDFDELGVVGQLALPAFQRHQNHHQPSNINTFRSNIVIFGHFRPIFFDQKISIFDAFWWYFGMKMIKNQNMATKCINIARLMMILASLESLECHLFNGAIPVKIRPVETVEGRFVTMFWFNIHTSYPQMRPERI